MGRYLRELGVAWVRLMLAYVLVFGAPLLGLPNLLPIGAMLATPWVFVRDFIVRKEAPYFRRGYLAVMIFGPGALLFWLLFVWPSMRVPGVSWAEVLAVWGIGSIAFEVLAALMTLVYVGLWRLGDRWFAPGQGSWASAKRFILAAAILVGGALYVLAMRDWALTDSCLDSGGRVGKGMTCEYSQR